MDLKTFRCWRVSLQSASSANSCSSWAAAGAAAARSSRGGSMCIRIGCGVGGLRRDRIRNTQRECGIPDVQI
jgi:hypothetical protein